MLSKIRLLLLVPLALLLAAPALAVPVTYGITAGTITVQANQTLDNALIFNQTFDLSTDSFVDWDSAGVPASGFGGTIPDFLFRIIPGGPFPLEPGQSYGPFDMITVESGDIAPDLILGYDTLLTFPNGPGSFLFQSGQIDVDATYSAENSVTGASTPGAVPANIVGVNNMNGTVTFTGASVQVVLDSIVMGTLDGAPFGEAGNDLVITANINFFGDSNVTPTPEPSTGLMVALGLVGLGIRRRMGARR